MGQKQLAIAGTTPGAEGQQNEELERVLAPYVNALYQRMALQKVEKEKHALVLLKMEEQGTPFYEFRDANGTPYEITIGTGKKKVKCKRINEDGDLEDDEDGDDEGEE